MNTDHDSISDALEGLALALGRSGAVPLPDLVRSLERAADRLRTRSTDDQPPDDLVTQSEAARRMGVSRQAVNQWVSKGALRAYDGDPTSSRHGPEVSLAEVAIVANRRSRDLPFSGKRRRELLDFLEILGRRRATSVAGEVSRAVQDDTFAVDSAEQTRVLREFVVGSMGIDGEQQEFDEAGLTLLARLEPAFAVDIHGPFGRLARSLGLLVDSASGLSGFDSPAAALLGLLGAATVGAVYDGKDADCGRDIAVAAREVWGQEWPARLHDAAFHVGRLRPTPLTRFTGSLTYLDTNRFLRTAQSSGVSIAYARAPGALLPQCFYGAPILQDLLAGQRDPATAWSFSSAAAAVGRPDELPSGQSPFRVFLYDFGLLDRNVHGIRRYCYAAADARREFERYARQLKPAARARYLDCSQQTLARILRTQHLELVSIDDPQCFDWWKDHTSRASPAEILIGLRDERARRTAHGLLVQTSSLPEVVEAAESNGSLRERLRIYVKNLEFDVIDARYRDDLRRGGARLLKQGGVSLAEADAERLAAGILREVAGSDLPGTA